MSDSKELMQRWSLGKIGCVYGFHDAEAQHAENLRLGMTKQSEANIAAIPRERDRFKQPDMPNRKQPLEPPSRHETILGLEIVGNETSGTLIIAQSFTHQSRDDG